MDSPGYDRQWPEIISSGNSITT